MTSLSGFLDWLRRIFRRGDKDRSSAGEASPADIARRLVEMIRQTQPEEFTCEEVFALLDQFADALERGDDVSALMPMVRGHLEICADCKEEFEALLRMLQGRAANPQRS
ncbi:MAG TPA: hypothetical protein VI729_12700 [Anaerolineales bacterium]|nr:MAG: hypothetical protein A2Z37_13810 [Chloroflexi bacterium RBG_19FT_COMBO_62_14]HLE05454.1 hypothetical protein [Anaerolineales bacterium]